jgi:hypothetical protein
MESAARPRLRQEGAMKKLLRAAFLAAICLPAMGYGACGHSVSVDYCGPELLSLIYVNTSGLVYVRPTTSLTPTPAGFACQPVSGAYFVLNPNAPNFKQVYATLLSARVSGAPVTLVADPALSSCTILYVTL